MLKMEKLHRMSGISGILGVDVGQIQIWGKQRKVRFIKTHGEGGGRINDPLNKALKMMADTVEENAKPIMENLGKMGEIIEYGKKMNSRIYNLSFGKIQSCMSYECLKSDLKAEFVNPKNTSIGSVRSCLNKPSEYTYIHRCGSQIVRRPVETNIILKLRMWSTLRSPPKAPDGGEGKVWKYESHNG